MPERPLTTQDAFTPEERESVEALGEALRARSRGFFLQVYNFQAIQLDGECTLEALAALVAGLQHLQAARPAGSPSSFPDSAEIPASAAAPRHRP